MPIRPENKKRYPKDWKTRSKFIRKHRAKNKCEWCGVPNYAVGWRDAEGCFHGIKGNVMHDLAGEGISYPSLEMLTYKEARGFADECNFNRVDEPKTVVIVLTVAHVYDHRPEAANFLNLAALCQRCHNVHDMKMRQQNRIKNKEQDFLHAPLFLRRETY